jgi:hypothetical protein
VAHGPARFVGFFGGGSVIVLWNGILSAGAQSLRHIVEGYRRHHLAEVNGKIRSLDPPGVDLWRTASNDCSEIYLRMCAPSFRVRLSSSVIFPKFPSGKYANDNTSDNKPLFGSDDDREGEKFFRGIIFAIVFSAAFYTAVALAFVAIATNVSSAAVSGAAENISEIIVSTTALGSKSIHW